MAPAAFARGAAAVLVAVVASERFGSPSFGAVYNALQLALLLTLTLAPAALRCPGARVGPGGGAGWEAERALGGLRAPCPDWVQIKRPF